MTCDNCGDPATKLYRHGVHDYEIVCADCYEYIASQDDPDHPLNHLEPEEPQG